MGYPVHFHDDSDDVGYVIDNTVFWHNGDVDDLMLGSDRQFTRHWGDEFDLTALYANGDPDQRVVKFTVIGDENSDWIGAVDDGKISYLQYDRLMEALQRAQRGGDLPGEDDTTEGGEE